MKRFLSLVLSLVLFWSCASVPTPTQKPVSANGRYYTQDSMVAPVRATYFLAAINPTIDIDGTELNNIQHLSLLKINPLPKNVEGLVLILTIDNPDSLRYVVCEDTHLSLKNGTTKRGRRTIAESTRKSRTFEIPLAFAQNLNAVSSTFEILSPDGKNLLLVGPLAYNPNNREEVNGKEN